MDGCRPPPPEPAACPRQRVTRAVVPAEPNTLGPDTDTSTSTSRCPTRRSRARLARLTRTEKLVRPAAEVPEPRPMTRAPRRTTTLNRTPAGAMATLPRTRPPDARRWTRTSPIETDCAAPAAADPETSAPGTCPWTTPGAASAASATITSSLMGRSDTRRNGAYSPVGIDLSRSSVDLPLSLQISLVRHRPASGSSPRSHALVRSSGATACVSSMWTTASNCSPAVARK